MEFIVFFQVPWLILLTIDLLISIKQYQSLFYLIIPRILQNFDVDSTKAINIPIQPTEDLFGNSLKAENQNMKFIIKFHYVSHQYKDA